ncbi:DUF6252 family protein [Hymenobacter chitinivorans]|uniref:Uncharacterized protein n=1 Tax=Hymenobacter chitinivorans DSM 11115 TaxID=1121954 RepID=A0A2M9BL73_9BACT|nr:DUF6252 family protein [Hymenobacter chitinivorans]PJJ58675.1 hypothetical protein CLV45_0085 [Hymenobacter chitinivorans DSM 11115]
MKTLLTPVALLRILLLSSLVGLAACGSKDSEDPTPDPAATAATNEVHWKISGTEYVARDIAQAQAHYRPTTADNLPATAKDMVIIANDGKNYQLTLLMTNFTGVGTYTMTSAGGTNGGFTLMDGSKLTYSSMWSAKAPAGQFVVTEFDAAKSILKGTFSFNARVRISSGVYGSDQDVTSGTFSFKSLVKY